jgi:hypothetical protein
MMIIEVKLTRLASGVLEARPVLIGNKLGTNILRGRSLTNRAMAMNAVEGFYASKLVLWRHRIEFKGGDDLPGLPL